jgi:hypothetical protein
MPTGYTAAITEGATFQEFILSCARAFGACITMRDDPSDAPIPDAFEPSPYYRDAVAKCERDLAELETLSLDEAQRRAEAERSERLLDAERGIAKEEADQAAYESMLRQVEAWVPPTSDHGGLKKFMRDQIALSIGSGSDYYSREREKWQRVRPNGVTWKARSKTDLMDALERARKHYAEEVERTNGRTQWVRALRESLELSHAVPAVGSGVE